MCTKYEDESLARKAAVLTLLEQRASQAVSSTTWLQTPDYVADKQENSTQKVVVL